MMEMKPSLIVENLSVSFGHGASTIKAVDGVSLTVGKERVAIVGESGSGKSQTGRAILGLSPKSAKVHADRLEFDGIELNGLSERQWRGIRGKRISMIMQDPKFSLNPTMTIGAQIVEAAKSTGALDTKSATEKTLDMLASVRISDPKRMYNLYPHEVSGGMGQRAMIAMMLVTEPQLLIADEPTSALDVSVQEQVISILDEMVRESHVGLLMITHDLRLVRRFCDRVIVMYKGKIVEELASDDLLHAEHPYTRNLLRCVPSLTRRVRPLPTKEDFI